MHRARFEPGSYRAQLTIFIYYVSVSDALLFIYLFTGFWWGNLRERDLWGDQDVDERIILRWIFRKWEGVVGTGWSWLRIGTGGGRL